MRNRSYVLVGLAVVVVIFSAALAITATRTSTAQADEPQDVELVPATIPDEGVTLFRGDVDLTLMPVPPDVAAKGHAATRVSAEQVLSIAPRVQSAPEAPMVVLAVVTVGSTVPSAVLPGEEYNAIQDRLAWVIVYTHPPRDALISRPAGKELPPVMVTHTNFIVDAETGDFLLGFFTK